MPSDREAVKLLTVHKAKGLEWEVVFLPALMKGVFPSDRVTDNWVINAGGAAGRPARRRGSIPQLAETTNAAMADYKRQLSRPAAARRGPAGLRRRDPGQAAAGRHRPLLAGRPDATRGRLRPTFGRSSTEAVRQDELLAEAAPPGTCRTRWSSRWPRSRGRRRWIRKPWRGARRPREQVQRARRRFAERAATRTREATPLLLDG